MTQRVKSPHPGSPTASVRIVVAADDPQARQELLNLLAAGGLSPVATGTPAEAARAVAENDSHPGLLLVANVGGLESRTLPLLEEAGQRWPVVRRVAVTDPAALATLSAPINSGVIQRLLLRPLTPVLVQGALAELAERATLLAEASALTELTVKQSRELDLAQRLMRLQRLAAVGQLAAGLAHEINNPLGTILAFAQILMREGHIQGEDLEALTYIEQGAIRCKRVIDAVVRFSHASGASPLREEVQLVDVAREALQLMAEPFERQDVAVSLREPPGPVTTRGTYQHLLQVAQELLANAAEAVKHLRGPGRVTLSVYQRGDRACLSVEDNGRGVNPGLLDRIFEPFFTTKDEGEAAGLGLTTADRIAQDHGGLIEVASRVDEGSTFTLVLPLFSPLPLVSPLAREDAAEVPRP